MGQNYSYNQPSSSEEYDIEYATLLQAEADAFCNEGESSYQPQPECDEGTPTTCYCGAEPVVATAYTTKDTGRRYFTCDNVNDRDCRIWKWLDVAFMEELTDIQRQLRLLKNQGLEIEQKLGKVEKTMSEFVKKKSVGRNGFVLGVCVLGSLCIVMVIVVLVIWVVTQKFVNYIFG